MDLELNGKTVLITGAGSGMGQHMALGFAAEGAKVAINDINAGGVAETLALLRNAGGEACEACDATADITDLDAVNAMVDAVAAALGGIDILINNAALLAEHALFLETDPAACEREIRVILHGTMHCSRAVLPGMIERGWGRIINIASTAASVGAETSAAYCASKAAVVGLSRCVALEGAPHGVSCNAISPGWVETKFGTGWMTHIAETAEDRTGAEYIDETKQTNPQKRMIQPEEIGALAVFLCRDEAFGITMQDITVSAGSLW